MAPRFILLIALALSGCAFNMPPDQVRRAYQNCRTHDGLAYVRASTWFTNPGEGTVTAVCRDGSRIKTPRVIGLRDARPY